MKKIVIVGAGGAGKTHLAVKLSKILNIPLYHLDTYFYKPDWKGKSIEEFVEINTELIKKERWILDGNFKSTMQMRMEACDTIIFMDKSRLVCYYNVLIRLLKYYSKHRPDMAEGCTERFDWDFIKWIWIYPKNSDRLFLL